MGVLVRVVLVEVAVEAQAPVPERAPPTRLLANPIQSLLPLCQSQKCHHQEEVNGRRPNPQTGISLKGVEVLYLGTKSF